MRRAVAIGSDGCSGLFQKTGDDPARRRPSKTQTRSICRRPPWESLRSVAEQAFPPQCPSHHLFLINQTYKAERRRGEMNRQAGTRPTVKDSGHTPLLGFAWCAGAHRANHFARPGAPVTGALAAQLRTTQTPLKGCTSGPRGIRRERHNRIASALPFAQHEHQRRQPAASLVILRSPAERSI